MANLIIKPSAGGDLVIQGSDASPAITVGTTGTTTFAESATMSGNVTMSGTANNLGTTTAGTLSSGVTFPAGHVIQTTLTEYHGGLGDAHANTNAAIATASGSNHWTGQITNVAASSKVRVTMSFCWNVSPVSGSRTDIGGGFSLFREAAEIKIAKQHAFYLSGPSADWNWYQQATLDWIDDAPATGTNNYFLGIRATDTGGSTIRVRSASDYEPFRCILQEIKQ